MTNFGKLEPEGKTPILYVAPGVPANGFCVGGIAMLRFGKFGKRRILCGVLLLLAALECVFIGMLLMGNAGANEMKPRPLTDGEAAYYAQYTLTLPDGAQVLDYCTLQEEKRIGGEPYRLYTSDELPPYLYQCREIRNILETEAGTLYITYLGQDGEAVYLTVLDGDILYRGIYTEKTDTYYGISREESYKVLHFRNQRAEFPALWVLAAVNGAALLCVLVLLVRSGKKRNTEEA